MTSAGAFGVRSRALVRLPHLDSQGFVAMIEFEAGAIFGICVTIILMLVFMSVFGQEEPSDDEWDPWGRKR